MNKPCNDCVYARNRADVDEDCDCISLKIYNGYQQGKADGIDDALFVLYDKGYIESDTEEYVREKLKEQK